MKLGHMCCLQPQNNSKVLTPMAKMQLRHYWNDTCHYQRTKIYTQCSTKWLYFSKMVSNHMRWCEILNVHQVQSILRWSRALLQVLTGEGQIMYSDEPPMMFPEFRWERDDAWTVATVCRFSLQSYAQDLDACFGKDRWRRCILEPTTKTCFRWSKKKKVTGDKCVLLHIDVKLPIQNCKYVLLWLFLLHILLLFGDGDRWRW